MIENYVIWNSETGEISAYPRFDNAPVVGLQDPPYKVLAIVRQSAPAHDPATGELAETRTIDPVALQWIWGWEVRPLPPVVPVPDWRTFKRTLLADPGINQLLGGGVSAAPAAAISVPATLLDAATGGGVDDFRAAWLALRRQGLVSAELLQQVRGLAIGLHLPAEFVSALGGGVRPPATELGQEWVDSSGDLWVVVQARSEDGQFLPDDPATPERESLVWELSD